MNATDMTVDPSGVRDRLPTIPATAVDELVQRQPTLERPGRPPTTPPSATANGSQTVIVADAAAQPTDRQGC